MVVAPQLVLGYATIFTIAPIFSLVLDEDVSEANAMKFPELYRELQKRRSLSVKTFLIWAWKALYQGGVIMLGGVLLFEQRFVHVVGITFTALILTENLMVAVEVKRWHPFMLLAQVLTPTPFALLVAPTSPALPLPSPHPEPTISTRPQTDMAAIAALARSRDPVMVLHKDIDVDSAICGVPIGVSCS